MFYRRIKNKNNFGCVCIKLRGRHPLFHWTRKCTRIAELWLHLETGSNVIYKADLIVLPSSYSISV